LSVSIDQQHLCLHQLFEEQARRTPKALALADRRIELTYGELNRRAELLADHLRGAGVGPEVMVGVYMERCVEYVIACLAAMKAGGAFLTLEMAYPSSLLAEVVADSIPPVVLTFERHAEALPQQQSCFFLDEGWEDAVGESVTTDATQPSQENLAFVSYSSGTTGKPKGIANPHRAAVRSYFWRFGIVDYHPGDRVGCNVFFIWEVFRPLLRGATSYVIPDDVIYDPSVLVDFLEEHQITETLFTPSLLESVLNTRGPDLKEKLPSLRTLWLNGEVVTKTLARRALALLPRTRLLNVFSASETHEVAAGDLNELVDSASATYCPVGRPMYPDRLYILGEDGRRVPNGEAGELYVGGDCLARGYVNLPGKTAERFLEDPFAAENGARMYRTGDRSRMLPDGNLEVMGRVDFMVKVRGYSVELEAVEAAIERHLAVQGCVVVAEGEEGEDKRLVAYLVPSSGSDEREERYAGWRVDPRTGHSPDVRRVLQESLPHYMVPAVFVEVTALPLQETTGKVDRRRLPPPPARVASKPGKRAREIAPIASRADKEALLSRTWEDVLGLEEGGVKPDDDFFDLGGHSLAAAELSDRVEGAFGVHVSMREFVEDPTVVGLCDKIEAKQRGGKEIRGAGMRRPSHPAVNLRAEAFLDPAVTPERAASGGAIALQDARRVFITGATGFLGAFLLDSLLSETDATLHCLVRPGADGRPIERPSEERGTDLLEAVRGSLERYGLRTSEQNLARRIVPVAGTLSEPLLGMTEDAFEALAGSIDAIFHAGAAVNLVYPYSVLKAANVGGTREIIRLACTRKTKPLHHVSSNAVFPPHWGACMEDADLDALSGSLENGYGQSKWVAEKMVWQAAERGLPVRVYRPGNISGHSVTGASNPRDLLGASMAGSLRLGCAPEIGGWRMEMTPVDFVSRAILRLADEPTSSGRAYHLADPDPVPASVVFDWLEGIGYHLDRVPYPDWAEAWRAAQRREEEHGGIMRGAAPEARDLWDGNAYDDANTKRALRGGDLNRPEIGASLIGTYARHFAERGWVEPPPNSPSRLRTVSGKGARRE
jgi:amino acid adenylation domain-containing protein/thioester reductase-like protein